MKAKSFFVIMVTYLVIFGALAVFFIYSGRSGASGSQNIFAIFTEGCREMFSKIGGLLGSIKIKPPINASAPIFSQCNFKEDFTCLIHQEDRKGESVLLNLKSQREESIILYEESLSGSISCNLTESRLIKAYEEFYVKLENCTFSGEEAKIQLKYYRYGSSVAFGRTAEGVLVSKE